MEDESSRNLIRFWLCHVTFIHTYMYVNPHVRSTNEGVKTVFAEREGEEK